MKKVIMMLAIACALVAVSSCKNCCKSGEGEAAAVEAEVDSVKCECCKAACDSCTACCDSCKAACDKCENCEK